MPRSLVLARWVFRSARADVLAYAGPRWILLALAIVELDAMIVDWRPVVEQVRRLSPLAVGLGAALAAALLAADARALVDTALLGPRLGVLRRQPVPGIAWWLASLVVLAPAAAPLGAVAGLAYGGHPGWLALGGALAVPAVVARGGWRIPAVVGAGVVAAMAQATGAPVAWAAAAWVAGGLAGGVGAIAFADDRPHAAPRAAPLRPWGPWTALVHRDLLALWRTERTLVGGAATGGVLVAVVAGAMHRTGDWAGLALTAGALVLVTLLGPLSLAAVTRVAARLGPRLDPAEWPVTARQRAAALAAVGSGVLAPGWAGAAMAATPIGVGHVRIVALVLAIGAGAAWWVAARPSRPNPGTWPYWLGACLAGALAPGGGLWAFALAGLALHRADRALERRRLRRTR